ncbi:MAG TPA: metalloregulator ArsR/SmtB family transcription factor [Cyclobacteriaceae bacterium]|nr:metalloregulator ArsR/SmtB family transcription factor [Cyclobacteriaceae bacterium]
MNSAIDMNQKQAEKISKALADPNRLLIMKEIRKQKGSFYCAELENVVDLAQPSICHHMKLLTDTEIVLSEKEGRNVKYSINNEVLDEYIDFLKTLKKP